MVGVLWLAYGVSNWMQLPASRPFYPRLEAFREIRHLAALIVFIHGYAVGQGLVALVVLLSLRLALRAEWLALAAWIGVMATRRCRDSIGESVAQRVSRAPRCRQSS